MALTPNRPKRLPGGVLLVILCLLSVALMTVWAREGTAGPLHRVKAGVETVSAPLKTVGSVIATPFVAVGDFFGGLTTDAKTVEELREQNEELQSLVIRMEEYRQENERLSALLDLKDAYRLDSVAARVISTSSDSWNRVLTINKGSIAGFEVGMPVLSANGLIGQIESVSPASSVVRLITDETSGVSAFLQSSRTEGVLTGSVDGVLYLEYIPLSVAVEPGDAVITSGAGGIYPKGIPIGEVATVKSSDSDVYKTITVKPITRVTTYEEVLVLIGSEAEIGIPETDAGEGAEAGAAANTEASGPQGTGEGAAANTEASGSQGTGASGR
jgi:rod shape-determining protein MreC